jgi:hypothetical protein
VGGRLAGTQVQREQCAEVVIACHVAERSGAAKPAADLSVDSLASAVRLPSTSSIPDADIGFEFGDVAVHLAA